MHTPVHTSRCLCKLPFLIKVLLCGCICFSINIFILSAQDEQWDTFIEHLSTDDNVQTEGWEVFMEELSEWHNNPLNINVATKEDFERLPFMTPLQVEKVLAYIYRYGGLKSMGELQFIPELDYQTRRFLKLFFYAGDTPKETKEFKWKDLLTKGKNTVLTRLDIPLYIRNGYRDYSDEELLKNPNKIYQGNAVYSSLKYQYNYRNRLMFGIVAEKDAGEPFGYLRNWSYDSYSFHIMMKNVGWLKTLVLGDYRLSYGEGLVINNGFSFGKTMSLSSSPRGIRRNTSTDECRYLRGMALSTELGGIEVSAFYSHRKLDATLTDEGEVSSIRTDGYHRTLGELDKKHNLTAQTMGGNIEYTSGCWNVGATGYYLTYSKPFIKGNALYRTYYPEGKHFGAAGVHYGYKGYRLLVSGESAYSTQHGGFANLNKALYRFNERYKLTLLQRFYSYKYYSFHASAFGEGSDVRNESGVYVGLESRPLSYLEILTYADFFYFPWPRYTLSHKSNGQEAVVQARYTLTPKLNFLLRYQFKNKEKSDLFYHTHKLKAQVNWQPMHSLSLQTTALLNHWSDENNERSIGYALVHSAKYITPNERIQLSATASYFNTDDYNSRLYYYEPGLLHSFYYPAYYGNGWRGSLLFQWKSSDWMIMMKYGVTKYFDRSEIGSGLQCIPHSSKNDISVQLRYMF